MIINLTHTTINDILLALRNGEFHLGEVAIDRTLTLLVVCEPSNIECSVMAAVESSRHHPCRIIVFVIPYGSEDLSCLPSDCNSDRNSGRNLDRNSDERLDHFVSSSHLPEEDTYLDAQLRMGSEAGAGDVIILFPHGELLRHLDSLARPLLVSGAPHITWWTSWTTLTAARAASAPPVPDPHSVR